MGVPPTIEVANLGMADTLILMVLALVVFGPRRLPQIGRQLGKLMYEFRKASNDFKFQMEEELRLSEEADRRKKEEVERQRTLALAAPAQESVTAQPPTGVESSVTSPDSASPYPAYPYPGEEVYPAVTAEVSEPAPEEPYPQIQPPSTGETVPAERPSRYMNHVSAPANETTADATGQIDAEAAQQTDAPAEQAATEEQIPAEQAPAEPTAPATEAVSHNG